MNYLVTGGAGFIGSHITDALLSAGHRVTVLDDLSTGNEENINKRAKFILADIRNLGEITPHFRGIDGVFHAAALPRVQFSLEQPIATNEVNVTGTLHVLVAARDQGVKRVVYSASSSAYGNSPVTPLHEGLPPQPMSPYGLQKYIGEEYCRLFSLAYGLETVSLRYFNVYGPRMAGEGAYRTVIKTFLMQKAKGEPLTIVGDGEQTRDFTHVCDVVRANSSAMESKNVGKGETVNIGAGKDWSVNAIAKLIGGSVTHIPPRLEPRATRADNRRAKELLGWEPKEKFEDAIQELMALS